jgi:hypothetical protein
MVTDIVSEKNLKKAQMNKTQGKKNQNNKGNCFDKFW